MKIAYIILAHKNPEQLGRLINRLNGENVVFSVHIDLNSDLHAFKKEVFLKNNNNINNVYFLEDRYKARWGSFNTIKATVSLIKSVIPSNPDNIIFLSGQDYPIKSNETIREFLQKNKGKAIIEFQKVDLNKDNHINFYSFADYFDYKKEAFNKNNVPLFVRIFNKIAPRRKIISSLVPYIGRQWFIFPLDIAKYVVDEYSTNKTINNFYKYTLLSDEQYFQTMLMNSKYAKSLLNLRTNFADYTGQHPAVWKAENIDFLKKQDPLFARKFDTSIDEKVLDLIDQELLTR